MPETNTERAIKFHRIPVWRAQLGAWLISEVAAREAIAKTQRDLDPHISIPLGGALVVLHKRASQIHPRARPCLVRGPVTPACYAVQTLSEHFQLNIQPLAGRHPRAVCVGSHELAGQIPVRDKQQT